MKALRLGACAVLAQAFVGAQSTWVVDKQGGPGSHFTEVQPAIQAAAPNDTILVRGASYQQGFTIDRPLQVVGVPGSGGLRPMMSAPVGITGIPAGASCLLSNFALYGWGQGLNPPYGLRAHGNAGRVQLESVEVIALMYVVTEFVSCDDVVLHGCGIGSGGTPILIQDSTVRAGSSWFHAPQPFSWSSGFPSYYPSTAVHVVNSHVALADVAVTGANGYGLGPLHVLWNALPALTATNATLAIGPECLVRGGSIYVPPPWLGYPPMYTAGIGNFSGTLIRDPTAQVTPTIGTVQVRHETWIEPVVRGSTFRVDVRGPAGGVALVAASFAPGQPIGLPEGTLWLDLGSAVWLGAVALDAQGAAHFDRTAGQIAAIDRACVVQAALLDAMGAATLAEPMFFAVLPQ